MKGTGIIRRIDDLGRIAIPKEIRRTMKLKEGDPIEFYIGNGELYLKKYSPCDSVEREIDELKSYIELEDMSQNSRDKINEKIEQMREIVKNERSESENKYNTEE